jgi:capsular polysaccharide biosynthesis protein
MGADHIAMINILRSLQTRFRSEHRFDTKIPASNDQEGLFTHAARADEIVPRVDIPDFVAGSDRHIIVCPAGRVDLNVPRVVNGVVQDYKIQEPDGLPRRLPKFPTESIYPNLTISRMKDALCIPGGVAVSRDRRIIAETFTCYWDRRFHHALKRSPEGYRLKDSAEHSHVLPGKYLYLDFQHISHYGHFIADVLPRMWAYFFARDNLNISDLKVLISRKPEPFIKELLNFSGLSANDIHEIDKPAQVEELFVATKALQLQDYAAPVLQQVWNTIGFRATSGTDGPRRIYLSRSRHAQRMLLNELDVEQMFSAHGFEIVHPEELPVPKQIDLIAHAELVAGTSGSNLFTLAFQRNLKSAFIITSPALIHITDSLLQVGRRCDLRTYIGEVNTSHPSYDEHWVHSPWTIQNLGDLERAVGEWTRDFS